MIDEWLSATLLLVWFVAVSHAYLLIMCSISPLFSTKVPHLLHCDMVRVASVFGVGSAVNACCLTLTTSRGVTAKAVTSEPNELETIRT